MPAVDDWDRVVAVPPDHTGAHQVGQGALGGREAAEGQEIGQAALGLRVAPAVALPPKPALDRRP